MSTTKIQTKCTTGGAARGADVGAQQLMSIPLETMGLVEGVDYWYEDGTDTPFIIDTGDGGAIVTVATLNWTAPQDEVYLAFYYCESSQVTVALDGEYAVYHYLDTHDPIGEINLTTHNARESTGVVENQWHTMPWVQAIGGISAGPNSISIRAQVWNGIGDLKIRRARMFVIRESAITSWQQKRIATDFNPVADGDGDVFASMPDFTQTRTPPALEQTIVLAMMTSETADANSTVPTYAIRDDTDGVNYAEDFGEIVLTTSNVTYSLAMAIKESAKQTTWKALIREANNTGNACNFTDGEVLIFGLKNKS